jgi:hypothetical protein
METSRATRPSKTRRNRQELPNNRAGNLGSRSSKQTDDHIFISVYMPCSSYTDEEYDEALEQLRELIRNRPSNSTLIIGGDFNASLGIQISDRKATPTGTIEETFFTNF